MHVTRHADATTLLADVGDYLVRREAEHNLPLGILGTLRDRPETYPAPPYLAVVRAASDDIALVAIRTPPYGLVLSEPGVPEVRLGDAVAALVADLAPAAPDLPTALGPKATVAPFVVRWTAATGHPARLELAQRAYRVDRVVPHPPVPGSWRLAEERDRPLMLAWARAFHDEALPAESVPLDEAMVDRWVDRAGRSGYLWELDGRPVSMVIAGSRTPSGRRIGPVYTPPVDRRHGYAGALTAAVTQDQLDHGARFCFLFTDLANPTANSIYQQIGYEPVTDIDLYRFEVRR